jgi:alpha-D-xyloside xylohydrolase
VYNIAPADHPAYQSILYYNRLRYRLLPYNYTLAGDAFHHDYTIMRGLVMDFPGDTAVRNINDQYMFGPSLLINPVYTYKATSRSVYLPAGQGWYDLYTGAYLEGGSTFTAPAPYERMPVFVKEGSIIPTGPELQYTSEKPADPITLYVYTGKDAAFTLYEDEGMNYNYEKGAFAQIPLQYDESAHTLTIGDRQGSFTGMLQQRTFYINVISKTAPQGMNIEKVAGKKIKYNGKKVVIKL